MTFERIVILDHSAASPRGASVAIHAYSCLDFRPDSIFYHLVYTLLDVRSQQGISPRGRLAGVRDHLMADLNRPPVDRSTLLSTFDIHGNGAQHIHLDKVRDKGQTGRRSRTAQRSMCPPSCKLTTK
jgi:hypothetical protein